MPAVSFGPYPVEPRIYDLPGAPLMVAYHEAGHCVVARVLSIEVVKLTMECCSTRRRNDPISCWSQSIIALSGPAAEQRYAGYSKDVEAAMWRSAWKTDRGNAQHWLLQLSGPVVTMRQCEAMAKHLVEEHWPAIVRSPEASCRNGVVQPDGFVEFAIPHGVEHRRKSFA
jgi:hypothetical protein